MAGVLAAHAAGPWGLPQVGAVRDAVRAAAPMGVDLIDAPAAPKPTPRLPPLRAPPPYPGIERSSGFAWLDDSALAAVRKLRFKPHNENGRATDGWVRRFFRFELEK